MNIKHPTFLRLRTRMLRAGYSSAKTPKGLLNAIRTKGLPPVPTYEHKPRDKWLMHALDYQISGAFAFSAVSARFPRLKNWVSSRPTDVETSHHSKHDRGFRYKGKYAGRAGREYVPLYFSRLAIAANTGAVAIWTRIDVNGKRLETRYKAPKGWKFRLDQLGPSLVKIHDPDCDFHFAGEELQKGIAFMRSGALRHMRLRKENARTSALMDIERQARYAENERDAVVFAKILPSLRIRLQDSLTAGNCIQGTLAYAESKGISRDEALRNPEAYLPGSKIDQNNPRAMNAAKAAFKRETLICI